MNIEEANKVLEELRTVEPEKLDKEALRVFKAIMKIADERDELREKISEYEKQLDLDYAEEKIDELYNALDNANWEKSQKDKIIKKKEKQLETQSKQIDLMAEELAPLKTKDGIVWTDIGVKNYFKKKASEKNGRN